jgi:hypothetical protein
MNLENLVKDPIIQKAAAIVAAGYAKRVMEGQYNEFFRSQLGQSLTALSRPSKLAIEAALNSFVAYVTAKAGTKENSPVKEFLLEMAKDAPSEIAKRMLNGNHATPTQHQDFKPAASDSSQRAVLEGLLRMDPKDLNVFVTWLKAASTEDRRRLAEAVVMLSEEQQKKLTALPAKDVLTILRLADNQHQKATEKASPLVQADLSAARSRLRNKLVNRSENR